MVYLISKLRVETRTQKIMKTGCSIDSEVQRPQVSIEIRKQPFGKKSLMILITGQITNGGRFIQQQRACTSQLITRCSTARKL